MVSTTRVVNVRFEAADIYIGRGSPYGNPYTHLPLNKTKALYKCGSRMESIDLFEAWVFTQPQILASIDSLRGKSLGCYCHPLPCHGNVYVRLVDTYSAMRRDHIEPKWNSPEEIAVIKHYYHIVKSHGGTYGAVFKL